MKQQSIVHAEIDAIGGQSYLNTDEGMAQIDIGGG